MQQNRYYKVKIKDDEEGYKIEMKVPKGKFLEFSVGTDGEIIIKKAASTNTISKDNCSEFQTALDEGHEEVSSTKTDTAVGVKNSEILKVPKETDGKVAIDINNSSDDIYSQLPTVSAGEYAKVLSVYTDNDGNKAVVPPDWTVSGVAKENIIWGKDKSIVIYHIPEAKVSGIDWKNKNEVNELMEKYDQMVWHPVNMLSANGTLDGIHFDEKFGRINYLNDEFSENGYYELLVGELALQKESVDKYGGFYSSRYKISKDEETGKPRSVKGADPWRNIDFPTAKEVASTMVESEIVTTHLMYGAEYDTREKWIIETETKTLEEVIKDSSHYGNYWKASNAPGKVTETGSREEWSVNNIADFTGNVRELTQEHYKNDLLCVARGGSYFNFQKLPAHSRKEEYQGRETLGFRVSVCIK